MKKQSLRFQFDEKKGVEALTYIASKWPGVTPFYASKVLFFAEKYHLNRYARPIVGGYVHCYAERSRSINAL